MKKMLCRAWALVCVLALWLAVLVPLWVGMTVSAAPENTPRAKTLYQQILERDGFIDGVWYPWFTHDNLGHGLTSNEAASRWITNPWYPHDDVGIDAYGADKVYAEIYNLKAVGYNMLAYAGSAYGEGVVFDDNGDVLGIKQEYLDNVARFLDICREVDMPVMWNICFHSSSIPGYYGTDAWNIICRMYADPTVADHYAQRFVKPLCKVLGEYDDVVALIALTDEVENEIQDSDIHGHGTDKAYGTTKENVLYFVTAINTVVAKELPHIARTVAVNSDDLGLYSELELDVLGRNRYTNQGNIPKVSDLFTTVPMLLTEYNIHNASGMSEAQISDAHRSFRKNMQEGGFQGGFLWCFQPNGRGGTHDLLAAGAATTADFRPAVYDAYYDMLDQRAAHRGETATLDTPVTLYYEGDGVVEWLPARQTASTTIQRSVDGGATWVDVVTDATSFPTSTKCSYQDSGAPATALYRIVAKHTNGQTATSAPTNREGAGSEYVRTMVKNPVPLHRRPALLRAPVEFASKTPLKLSTFGVGNNRPANALYNVITNAGFENESGGQWNTASFVGGGVQVVQDATAPQGSHSLLYDTSFTDTPRWHTFTVPVEKNTDYVLSAWVKGDYIADDNRFYASFGVLNPATGTFAVLAAKEDHESRQDQQLYPPAWDQEWHLRSVSFNSGNHASVVIGLYGCASRMWLDDIALYKQDKGCGYAGPTMGLVGQSYQYEYQTCEPSKSLTQDLRCEDVDATYWQSGAGWDNGFLSMETTSHGFGRSIKYTASANPAGVSYIKWIPVEKDTRYVVTFNYKVLKDGAGRVALAVQATSGVKTFVSLEFYGENREGWTTYSVMVNTRAFSRLGLVITDMGGEALIDNIRVFRPQDGSAVTDTPDGGGTPPTATVRPTTQTTQGGQTTLPDQTDPSAYPGAPTILPTRGEPTATPTTSVEGARGTPAPSEDSVLLSALALREEQRVLGIVLYAVLAAILAAGVTVAVVLLRKKGGNTPSDTPMQ